MALLTKTPWFGPKTSRGWGLKPVNKYGLYIVNIFVLAIVVAVGLLAFGIIPGGVIITLAAIVFLLLALLLTSDPPGGPGL